MCKRKDNLEKIKGFQTEVNFRLDFYARPGSLDKLFDSMPKNMDYFEYKPTEEEQQIIGYDDAARCLQKSLTELLFHTCKILKSKSGQDITIYVHRNFVSIQIVTNSSDENADIATYVSSVMLPFLAEDGINIEDLSTRVSFAQLGIAPKDLWTVFDHAAFPVLDEAVVRSGSYQDTHQVGDLFIDLTRNLQIHTDGNVDGVVSTVAFCSENSLRKHLENESLKVFLLSVVSSSIAEISRCFTS